MGQYKLPQYDIKIKLITAEKILKVTQTIKYRNGTPKALKTLYLNDWSHAYSSSKSPLAQRFAEEYDRRFYLGSKAKRGETSELKIFINNKEINWFRKENQLDIIRISLSKDLMVDEQINIRLSYNIEMPDARYTG